MNGKTNDFEEKTISSTIIFNGRIIRLRKDKVKLPNQRISIREIIEHPGAVVILAVNEENEIVLIKQYRKATEEVLWELPAGTLEKNETPFECAKRELQEETGYFAHKIENILNYFSTPGFCDEKLFLFHAQELEMRGKHEEEDEFIQVEFIKLEEALKMVSDNIIKDAKTIIGILYLALKK